MTKYIALDVDLLSYESCQNLIEKEVLRMEPDQVSVIALTNKYYRAIPRNLLQTKNLDYLILADGTEIRALKEDQLMYGHYLSRETVGMLYENLSKTDAVVEIQVNGKVFLERKHVRDLMAGKLTFCDFPQHIESVYGAMQLLTVFPDRIERIRIISADPDCLSKVNAVLRDSAHMISESVSYFECSTEIRPRGNSKKEALRIIQKRLHIRNSDLLALPLGMKM